MYTLSIMEPVAAMMVGMYTFLFLPYILIDFFGLRPLFNGGGAGRGVNNMLSTLLLAFNVLHGGHVVGATGLSLTLSR